MLSKRIIACLDVRDGQVVKGINFEGLRSAGAPAELARRYNQEGIDELVILDITATLERRRAMADTIRAVAKELFIPLAVGGGIRSDDEARAALDAGADKVAINSAALENPSLVTRLDEPIQTLQGAWMPEDEHATSPSPAHPRCVRQSRPTAAQGARPDACRGGRPDRPPGWRECGARQLHSRPVRQFWRAAHRRHQRSRWSE